MRQGCVSALYCITQSGKESASVQVSKEDHPCGSAAGHPSGAGLMLSAKQGGHGTVAAFG